MNFSLRIRPARFGAVLSATPAPAPTPRWAAGTTTPCPASRSQWPLQCTHPFSTTSPALSPPASSKTHVPAPIPLVPDVPTFLSIIGRNMKQHTAKFPSWEALFTLTSRQLRELGVEPPRDRRYLLRWLERFRQGRFGIGGDFRFVHGGVAQLRVREEVDTANPVLVHKTVVNVDEAPPAPLPTERAEGGEEAEGGVVATAAAPTPEETAEASPPVAVRGYKVVGARTIAGPFALPLRQMRGAQVAVTEGMWEDKRGRKIDGGERRRAEVQFLRRVAERRAAREQREGR